MSGCWGKHILLSIFGESHGPAVGVVIDGLPPGLALDMTFIASEMARRAPGRSEWVTPRTEADEPEILSGLRGGTTTGAPLCAVIRNEDARSGDYSPTVLRPGHADLTAFLKYKGFADSRGGGHFSGRLTAPLVFAGAIAKQILRAHGIGVTAKIISIGGQTDETAMRDAILHAKEGGDSVGGIVECVAQGVPAGVGSPFFDSLESVAASMLFSIPGVKGVEFGDGFAMASRRGSETNDGICVQGGHIRLLSNHNGGINGGITNGEPVVVRVAIKPTPTIAKEQPTVDVAAMKNTLVRGKGRHDPCIVLRAVPVVEAGLALSILDLMGEEST